MPRELGVRGIEELAIRIAANCYYQLVCLVDFTHFFGERGNQLPNVDNIRQMGTDGYLIVLNNFFGF